MVGLSALQDKHVFIISIYPLQPPPPSKVGRWERGNFCLISFRIWRRFRDKSKDLARNVRPKRGSFLCIFFDKSRSICLAWFSIVCVFIFFYSFRWHVILFFYNTCVFWGNIKLTTIIFSKFIDCRWFSGFSNPQVKVPVNSKTHFHRCFLQKTSSKTTLNFKKSVFVNNFYHKKFRFFSHQRSIKKFYFSQKNYRKNKYKFI